MAFPTKDAPLADFALNFGAKITANPVDYGTTAPIATQFETKRSTFATAYAAVVAAKEAGIRNSGLCATKDAAKADLLSFGRGLYAAIQFNPAVTNANKIAAGVTVRPTENQRHPAPAFSPGMSVEKVNGRLVTVRLYNAQDLASKARPAGTIGAVVLSHVGTSAPEDVRDWTLEGTTGELTLDVLFPESVIPGTTVFITSYWINAAKQSGPACWPAVSAVINYASSMPTAAEAA